MLLDVDVIVAGAGIAGSVCRSRRGRSTALARYWLIASAASAGTTAPARGAARPLAASLAARARLGRRSRPVSCPGLDRPSVAWRTLPSQAAEIMSTGAGRGMDKLPVIHNDTFGYLGAPVDWRRPACGCCSLRDVAGAIVDGIQRDRHLRWRPSPAAARCWGRSSVDSTGDADVAASAGAPTVDTFAQRSSLHRPVLHASADRGLGAVTSGFAARRRPSRCPRTWSSGAPAYSSAGADPPVAELPTRTDAGHSGRLGERRIPLRAGRGRSHQRVSDPVRHPQPERFYGPVEMTPTPRLTRPIRCTVRCWSPSFRRYIYETVQFLKQHAPGFEQVCIEQVAPFMGTRFQPHHRAGVLR